jgi:hypothetical protein
MWLIFTAVSSSHIINCIIEVHCSSDYNNFESICENYPSKKIHYFVSILRACRSAFGSNVSCGLLVNLSYAIETKRLVSLLSINLLLSSIKFIE